MLSGQGTISTPNVDGCDSLRLSAYEQKGELSSLPLPYTQYEMTG